MVTTSRADYSYFLPLLRAITKDPELRLDLMVSGMHLVPEFGSTIKAIEADGFRIATRIEMLLGSDTPEAIAKSVGLGIIGFGQAFSAFRPDILVVLGDRFEMQAAVIAAVPFNIPIAHIGGGEATEGLIDEAIRHSITKMSHLHFVSHSEYEKRVIQMGEMPWRVTVSGSLSLDNLRTLDAEDTEKLSSRIGMPLDPLPLVVTYHPLTLDPDDTRWRILELLAVLHDFGVPVVFTAANADTKGRAIMDAIKDYVDHHANARAVVSLGMQGYFSLLRQAAAMVGNSSSGILESASFQLPVVNIGDRQRGRLHAGNVVDCRDDRQSIADALRKVLDPAFRAQLHDLKNPYGDGTAASKIINVLKNVQLGTELIFKQFYSG